MTTTFILYIQICLVVLLTVCCCRQTWADSTLSLIQSRLLTMLKQKQRSYFRRTVRTNLDLREHRLFHSDPALECCPTVTEMIRRHTGINRQGVVLELFRTPNNTQTFYETLCHPAFKNRQCQYIDPRISYATRCIQQYSYVYAIGRTYGNYREQFGLDYIRIASGCKCQVVREYLKRRKKRSVTN